MIESFFPVLHNNDNFELMAKFEKIYYLLNRDLEQRMEEFDE